MRKILAATVLLLAAIGAGAAPPATDDQVAVTARVRTATGSAIGNAYVGLVPDWRPSSRPFAEEIAKKGVSVFRVPRGTYWLIAGAPGYSTSSLGPLTVAGTSVDVSIELYLLRPLTGSVIGEDGKAISGARVSTVNAAILPPLGKLSEPAARQLTSDWSVTTDENGIWTLQLPKGSVPLLFEVPGKGAVWRVRPEGDSTPIDVALSKGAKLTVTTDRRDANLVVTLSREEAGAPTTVPVEKQPLLWARPATTATLGWSSLPQGVYSIYAKYPEPRYFMQSAVKLGEVLLSPGDERELRVELPPVRQAATNSAALLLQEISREETSMQRQRLRQLIHVPTRTCSSDSPKTSWRSLDRVWRG